MFSWNQKSQFFFIIRNVVDGVGLFLMSLEGWVRSPSRRSGSRARCKLREPQCQEEGERQIWPTLLLCRWSAAPCGWSYRCQHILGGRGSPQCPSEHQSPSRAGGSC